MSLIHRLSTQNKQFSAQLNALTAWEASLDVSLENQVRMIIQTVRAQGDVGVMAYTARFDRRSETNLAELAFSRQQMKTAFDALPEDVKQALQVAAARIKTYHEHQVQRSWQMRDEYQSSLGQRVSALERVGLYVPGGKAAYPSSVLMNAIPAKVAGVKEIVMVSPAPDGQMNPAVLAAAWIAGVDRIFSIGGAQAIAALAYGTETIPAVDKIVGPGNAYVAMAKRLVFGQVGIDMIAGPSEIVIVSDGSTHVDWLVLDLFSQAEHDEQAQAIVLSPDLAHLNQIEKAIHRLLPQQTRKTIIETALKHRGALIHTQDLAEACRWVNHIAPEHLELSVQHPHDWLDQIEHAGAIFVGAYTSESLGDYCAGSNHVLPTARSARFSSALGVYDFQKRTTVLEVSREGAAALGKIAKTLADVEGLCAHGQSAFIRQGDFSV